MTPTDLNRCHAHIERAKAKVAAARKEPRDGATEYALDAIDSLLAVHEAVVEALGRMKP